MVLPTLVISIVATAAVVIFAIMFIYLVAKWSIKRGKEISKRFEYETKELQTREEKLEEIREQLSLLKTKHRQAIQRNDLNTANMLSRQIKNLERQRDTLFKKIEEY